MVGFLYNPLKIRGEAYQMNRNNSRTGTHYFNIKTEAEEHTTKISY